MSKAALHEILRSTRERVAQLRPKGRELSRQAAEAPRPKPFLPGLVGTTVGIVAEIKRRSPSGGAIREDLNPVVYAQACERGGAVAISVLTDAAHFGGSLDDLARVTRAVSVPVLRKDFILDELQLLEARIAGASAVLLIVRALGAAQLAALSDVARCLGLGTLIEIHSERELEQALAANPTAVGVNARDLATLTVDLGVTERLLPLVPSTMPAIAESGIETRVEVERVAAAGADLVLVGTSVARTDDPAAAVRALCGVPRRGRPTPGAHEP